MDSCCLEKVKMEKEGNMNFSAFKEGGQLPKSKPSIYVRGSEVFDLNKMYPDLKHAAAAFG